MASAAATINNPSSTELAVFDPSILDFSYTRTALLVLKWLGWGALCFAAATAAAVLVLLACAAAYVGVAGYRRRKAAKQQEQLRQRQRARMMSVVREAPYEQMVAAGIPSCVRNDPCVVCRAEYEAGETCSILPRCAHVYHKTCIAAWLMHHDTCPICNALVLGVM